MEDEKQNKENKIITDQPGQNENNRLLDGAPFNGGQSHPPFCYFHSFQGCLAIYVWDRKIGKNGGGKKVKMKVKMKVK